MPRRRPLAIVIAVLVLMAATGAGVAFGADTPAGEEAVPVAEPASGAPEPTAAVPTAEQTREALAETTTQELGQGPETDPKVAEELPHRDLTRDEALELAEGVFGAQLEAPAGIFDELEPTKFLSDHAAVVPASTLPEPAGEGEGGQEAGGPQERVNGDQPVLVESTLPLRTENAEGEEEAVDLNLQSPEGSGGELQPLNPLSELAIPARLGEGISLGGVQIEVVQAAPESTPTNVEEQYAFYPNVAENTDLVVAPTSTGVETMTDIRSAEAPRTTTYRLSLPSGATLQPGRDGGAEVIEGGKAILVVPPPTATDAAGEAVPVEMRVEDDELKVAISPEPSTAYPVLVDPNYISEYWCWAGCGQGFPGWEGSTTNLSYRPVWGAYWDPSHYGGLDLTSGGGFEGPAYSGTHADWSYWVPRYAQDMNRYGTPPTTFMALWMAEGVLFLPFGNYSDYPAMVIGLIELGVGWAPGSWVHYGGNGELSNWGNVLVDNPPPGSGLPQSSAVKGADENLVTYENEAQAKYRDTFIGESTVMVVDVDAPRILELQAPTGWITGASASIGYGFEDTGLGVWSAGIGLPGEAPLHAGWGTAFGCSGTAASPCPRVARSSEPGARPLTFVPNELPTGEDHLEVVVGDPLWEEGHHASGNVTVKVDNTAPEISLSGPLTEQEKLGITKAEYPLAISVTDGSEDDPPQSGVSSVEVKVDGKKVKMPKEEAWHPACSTRDCAFTGSWTLKASEYTPGDHEVEVLATDAVGHVARQVLEVELGEVPPQTSFTSPHPTYEEGAVSTIAFKATRAGAPVEGATFRCSIDGATAAPCATPFELPEHFQDGWHTFAVAATDKGGKADPTPAVWKFKTDPYPAAPAGTGEKLVYPEVGKKTASYLTLEAQWGEAPEGKAAEGVSGVTFQMELPGQSVFTTVPAGCTVDGQGRQVSWPLPARTQPGHSAPVYLKVRGCPEFEKAGYPEKEIQFRALFEGGEKVAGASEAVTSEFVSRYNANRVSTDATESVGPASVDLLTGSYTLSRTDVSIPVPGYEANLEFTRTYSSSLDKSLSGYSTVLGGAWQPGSPMESEYEGEAWTRIEEQVIPYHEAVYEDACWNEKLVPAKEPEEPGEEELVYPEYACPQPRCNGILTCEEWMVEEEQPEESWIELFDNEGNSIPFEKSGNGFVAPEWAKELVLRREGANIALAYPNGTHSIFVPQEGSRVWFPKFVSYQANAQSMRMEYATEAGSKALRLVKEIAPAPAVDECEFESTKKAGCRTLVFNYSTEMQESVCKMLSKLLNEPGMQCAQVLSSISYYGPSGVSAGETIAKYTYGTVTGAEGRSEEMLVGEVDPRLPALTESYGYNEPTAHGDLLTSVTPPGQEAWSFGYEHGGPTGSSRLKSVGRAGATTTIAYEVPVKGTGAPYDMSSEAIARWGETDLPVDATAIFPPNHVPSEYPPHGYTGATIHYMDPEGYEINTASPSPPGVAGTSISTTETDVHGNVVRELDPQNRLAALAAPEPVSRSHELDSHSIYSANGNEVLESWGPLHQVRLSSGELVEARQHTVARYDEEEPTPAVGTPWAYLPTKETVATVVPGKEGEFEPKVTVTKYNWLLRKPEETIVDPEGLKIRSVTKYNAAGQVEETRQPKGAAGGTAGDTRTIYYMTGADPNKLGCGNNQRYANLPCAVVPAAQESGTGRQQVVAKSFLAYNNLDEPVQVWELPQNNLQEARVTTIAYDAAGREVSTKITGGGTPLARAEAKTETVYSPTMGVPTEQRFVCEEKEKCTGFDNQATKTTYNALGQVTGYEDADGNKTETKYDAYGRPVTVTDGKGTETLHYDEASGVETSMEVSGVGTFTGTYDADGDLIERGLPNGLTAKTTYNQVGEPTKLAYTKTSSCGASCTWYEESLERSGEGRILASKSSLVSDRYTYDKDGRLTEAQETPTGGECTTRAYTFDADSNRLTKTTRSPGVKGACATTGGTVQKYEYDNADRLIGPTYDAMGRITALPAEFAGGKALETGYFANDMVASQTQNGVTNTFQLDATGRQRQREQTGGVAGVEVFHYDGPGDSPTWTSLGSTWSRNIIGIGGELAAIQESTGTTTFKLTDLHGDVVASASSSPTATKLLATMRFTEFGEPVSGSSGRFGWLGGKSRRTELSSGVIQMGARSYIPSLGRFLTPDPVRGGSANAYDYADQDPVNVFDIGGEKPKHFSKIKGVVKAGVRIRSPKNNNGRDSYGKLRARLYIRVGCGGCEGTSHLSVSHATVKIEKASGEVVKEKTIQGANLNKGAGEQPYTWNNWGRKSAPFEADCINGDEYQVTLTVTIGIGASRTEPYSVSAQAICGEG
jgi:RHS repeat-associated protein